MKYLVKLVFLVPVDAGADPESAGLARAVFSTLKFGPNPRVFRSIEYHLEPGFSDDSLRSIRIQFRSMFHNFEQGISSAFVSQLRNGPQAISICGAELHFREDIGHSVSEWQVLESWRKN